MGILLDDDDYPDHVPLPTSFPDWGTLAIVSLAGLVTVPICPVYPQHLHRDDSFHQEHPYEGESPSWIASGGSSTHVNPFVSNQILDAAKEVVIRLHRVQGDGVRWMGSSTADVSVLV